MARAKGRAGTNDGVPTSYESDLWRMADALRGTMDAAEYKHVVLGLIFLKYISDAFEERYAEAARLDSAIAENLNAIGFWGQER